MTGNRRGLDDPGVGVFIPSGVYLTTAEAAEVLAITRTAVQNALHKGRMTGVKTTPGWLIEVEEVDRYNRTRLLSGQGNVAARRKSQERARSHLDQTPTREAARDAVRYRLTNGKLLHVSKARAQALVLVDNHGTPRLEGTVADAIYRLREGEWTRHRVVTELRELTQYGLVARVASRDRYDAPVWVLWLTPTGAEVLEYARARGLV